MSAHRLSRTVPAMMLVLVLLAACSTLEASPRAALEPQAASSSWVPFPSLYLNGEWVTFTGSVHVVALSRDAYPVDPIYPVDPVRILTNLAGVRGVGETTGGVYLVTGVSSHGFAQSPSGVYDFFARYSVLVPPNPILPPSPIRQSLTLAYSVTLGDGGMVQDVGVEQVIVEGGP